jgi:hypothetical protein
LAYLFHKVGYNKNTVYLISDLSVPTWWIGKSAACNTQRTTDKLQMTSTIIERTEVSAKRVLGLTNP